MFSWKEATHVNQILASISAWLSTGAYVLLFICIEGYFGDGVGQFAALGRGPH